MAGSNSAGTDLLTNRGFSGWFSLRPHPVNTAVFWFLWLASLFVTVAWHATRSVDGWKWTTADWLINFEGGFVRRGLVGEVLLTVVPSNINIAVVVFVIQVLLLLTVYGAALALFMVSSRSNAWLMLGMSPAFLLFAPLSLEGSLRKEVMAVSAAALLAVSIRDPRLRWLPLLATALYSIGAVSHESVALALPGIVFLLQTAHGRGVIGARQTLLLQSSASLAALISLAIAFVRPGSPQAAQVICDRVRGVTEAEDICTGAIDAVGLGLQQSLATVSALLPTNIGYLGLIALSLVPFALLRASRHFWIKTGVVYIFLLPLFLVAWDYGRWIFLATSILSFIAFNELPPKRSYAARVPWPFVFAYLFMWSLPTLSLGGPPLLGRLFEVVYVPFSLWVAGFI